MKHTAQSNRRKGAALIEFGLGATVFLVVLFGAMDWSWVFFQHQTILWRASDAARWASANRLDDRIVTNLVLCGTTGDCGDHQGGFFADAQVNVQLIQRNDVIDTITTVSRYYAQVTVQDYKIHHFTPFLASTFTGKPIVVVQPMECQKASGDCTDWI